MATRGKVVIINHTLEGTSDDLVRFGQSSRVELPCSDTTAGFAPEQHIAEIEQECTASEAFREFCN